MCKVNPGHVVGDAGLAIISVLFQDTRPAWGQPGWGRTRTRRVRRRLLRAPRLMDENKIRVVPNFLEEQQSMYKTWEEIFLSALRKV